MSTHYPSTKKTLPKKVNPCEKKVKDESMSKIFLQGSKLSPESKKELLAHVEFLLKKQERKRKFEEGKKEGKEILNREFDFDCQEIKCDVVIEPDKDCPELQYSCKIQFESGRDIRLKMEIPLYYPQSVFDGYVIDFKKKEFKIGPETPRLSDFSEPRKSDLELAKLVEIIRKHFIDYDSLESYGKNLATIIKYELLTGFEWNVIVNANAFFDKEKWNKEKWFP